MQNENEMHHSNTTLFQNEYHFILLHITINTESLSGIYTKPLKHSSSSYSLHYSEISLILFLNMLKL